MEWNEIAIWVASTLITAFGGVGVAALVAWLKNLKWVKKLKIEEVIEAAGKLALHAAESWARKTSKSGTEKLEKAKTAFEAELNRQGIKLEAGLLEDRLESIFNKIKVELEKNKK